MVTFAMLLAAVGLLGVVTAIVGVLLSAVAGIYETWPHTIVLWGAGTTIACIAVFILTLVGFLLMEVFVL